MHKQAPTVSQIQSDHITRVAFEKWLPANLKTKLDVTFDSQLVVDIYQTEIYGTNFNVGRIMVLEFSQYLENYLWPFYDPKTATFAHLMSIIVMVNEKFRERVPAWDFLSKNTKCFSGFLFNLMVALQTKIDNYREHAKMLTFFVHLVNSIEVEIIRNELQRLVSFPILVNLCLARRKRLLSATPKFRKYWKMFEKGDQLLSEVERKTTEFQRSFLSKMIDKFLSELATITPYDVVYPHKVEYCERFLELIIDLEALLPTRRFFNTLLDDKHLLVKCTLSHLVNRPDGKLFSQLLDILKYYAKFEINDLTGEALSAKEFMQHHYDEFISLQKLAFNLFPEKLSGLCLSSVGCMDSRVELLKHLSNLSAEELCNFMSSFGMIDNDSKSASTELSVLLEIMVQKLEKRRSQLEELNAQPLYPTETVVWDENVVPGEFYSGEGCLALPKLNLQFLTLHDYLLRNFQLFRLESTYEIREDIEDAVSRMRPWKGEDGATVFGGWARMALPIDSLAIVDVAKPRLGESHPAQVRADVTVALNVKDDIAAEWENLRRHDVCFLITIRATQPYGTRYDYKRAFIGQVGLTYVRGCEVQGMLDEEGNMIDDWTEREKPKFKGQKRTYRVWLDPNQYQLDLERSAGVADEASAEAAEDVYETFNIFMRRKPKENNFKAVLETIRDLMNTECVVPAWLHDIILGYGDPGAAHYSKMPNHIASLDWNDTFLNSEHLQDCFSANMYNVRFNTDSALKNKPPFRLSIANGSSADGHAKTVSENEEPDAKRVRRAEKAAESSAADKAQIAQSDSVPKLTDIVIEPHVIPNRGPYPYNQPKRNAVRFTPTQIEAIRSGMQPGLTMVVGPPGTGKTDVAVQIIANLYHNFPEQRTLIVTHSNQALNQLFEKIMQLDIDERHLLRMGHGEEMLETEKDFSRYGRVNYVLAHRIELLDEANRLAKSLATGNDVSNLPLQGTVLPNDVISTCEQATTFYQYQVLPRWEEFEIQLERRGVIERQDYDQVRCLFPFHDYFANAPQPLFGFPAVVTGPSAVFDYYMDVAKGCFRHIENIFKTLQEYLAFELIRNGADRAKYLLVKEAKIVAMTCTHAALKRRDLVEVGFHYDNILMEESAQILEIETFIPLLLQNPERGGSQLRPIGSFNEGAPQQQLQSRLKRWIMIGDHHQLPPVIKNMSFQKYCNMEQSLFARFVRLGVPTVDLDAQGRARPSICSLYSWRYKNLGNLPHVSTGNYLYANAGFAFDYQLIDVEDYNGKGESEPSPFFYQNVAEAEYAVALFMYMRLLGYPGERVSILTTYNGQKHLIRDVLRRRCAENPLIGVPAKVTTVDRFQGQQNDYIILSLVRTKNVGHLRDVRRLVVAMSRARLGLYILARVQLFQNCFELTPAFNQLVARPLQLHLLPRERYHTMHARLNDAPVQSDESLVVVKDMSHMAWFVFDFYKKRTEFFANNSREYQLQMHQSKLLNKPAPAKVLAAEKVTLEKVDLNEGSLSKAQSSGVDMETNSVSMVSDEAMDVSEMTPAETAKVVVQTESKSVPSLPPSIKPMKIVPEAVQQAMAMRAMSGYGKEQEADIDQLSREEEELNQRRPMQANSDSGSEGDAVGD